MGRKTLKTSEASKLGRSGARKRAKNLSPEQRREIAQNAAKTRWKRG